MVKVRVRVRVALGILHSPFNWGKGKVRVKG